MWLGESEHSLDAKNRVHLPKRFLDGLDACGEGNPSAIVTRGFEDCLFVFSESGFKQALGRLKTQPFAGEQERRMQRLFFSHSKATQLDSAGRLLLPEKLKNSAAIVKDVVMLGLIDRIEIWAKDRWEAFHAAHGKEFDELDKVLLGGSEQDAQV
jgi:MraZ protein